MKFRIESLKSELEHFSAALFTLQETHFSKKGKLKIDEWEIFEAIRKKQGGGSMIGAHKSLNPVLIQEYSDTFELLVIEITIGSKEIWILSGYGPQEHWTEEERMPFWMALEKELTKAELAGKSYMLACDANSKLGSEIIPGDPHSQSANGKVLSGILERHAMIVLNGVVEKRSGVITRERITETGVERSVIDIVAISEDMLNLFMHINIDEDKKHSLTKITKTKKGVLSAQSDHNTIITQFNVSWDKTLKNIKTNIFNLKNKEGQQMFNKMTTQSYKLENILHNNEDISIVMKQLIKYINSCIHQCFRKVRISNVKNKHILKLFNKRRLLRTKNDSKSISQLKSVEEKLADLCANENYRKVKDEVRNINSDEGGFHAGKFWKLKKKLCPRNNDPPTALQDEHGNLVTSAQGVKKLTLKHIQHVLRNRVMKDDLKNIQIDQEIKCQERIQMASKNKSSPWNMDDLKVVLNYLKRDKSRDPHGHANELFRCDVLGDGLMKVILYIMNRIKSELKIPEELCLCNVSCLWKGKGQRNDLNNHRGIFRTTVLRNILDRLIYNDIYPIVDGNLTDCNVGSRKGRNIRDNLFVLNAILNSVNNGKEDSCEIVVYDVEKCFDSLWSDECINDLYDAGVTDDKLVLLYLENYNAQIAVKTPHGLTERVSTSKVIMQGTVLAGLYCTNTMDKLGKHVYQNKELQYLYKGTPVPCLQMVDDILTITTCSPTSTAMNQTVNRFTESKKLKLSYKKCLSIHIGRHSKNNKCEELKVHEEVMKTGDNAVYLGDTINKSGSQKQNIIDRQAKAYAAFAGIRAILEDVPLGRYRIEIGLELRQAMFINAVLFNSEVWQGYKATDIARISKVDHALLRYICGAHAKTPVEFLYLETASTPIPFIISSRRLIYLQNVLKRSNTELIKRVYEAQKENPTKGDFIELIKADMNLIGVDLDDDLIEKMDINVYKKHIKSKIRESAFKYLCYEKTKHKKVSNIIYDKFTAQDYIKSTKFTNAEVELLIAFRSNMVRGMKKCFPSMYGGKNLDCPLMCLVPDTPEHLLECSVIILQLSTAEKEELKSVQYNFIFGTVHQQKQVVKVLTGLMDRRTSLLNVDINPASGSSLDAGPFPGSKRGHCI
jgi:hypothetical protein